MMTINPFNFLFPLIDNLNICLNSSWPLTIISLPFITKVACFPFTIFNLNYMHKFNLNAKDIALRRKRIDFFINSNQKSDALGELSKLKKFMKDKGIEPYRMIYGLLSPPIHILTFMAVKDIFNSTLIAENQQFLWIESLKLPDKTCILPIINSSLTSFNMEVNIFIKYSYHRKACQFSFPTCSRQLKLFAWCPRYL